MTDPTSTDDNKLIAERRAKLAKLRDGGNAFPNDFRRTAMAGDLQAEFGGESKEALAEQNRSFAVAGRLIRNRGSFLLIQDGSDTIQLYIDRKGLDENHWETRFHHLAASQVLHDAQWVFVWTYSTTIGTV